MFLILYMTVQREQVFLASTFGREFTDYAARVPIFFPNPRLFRTEPTLVVSTDALRRSLFDAFVFLSAFPLAELAEAFVSHFGYSGLALP